MSKVDYTYKAYVLKEHGDLIRSIKKANMLDYAKRMYEENGVITYTYKHNDGVDSQTLLNEALYKGLNKEYFEARKIIKADNNRRVRLRKRIASILENGDSLFLTLTFDDDKSLNFKDTTEKQRRVAVVRYLKSLNVPYVANIDYGGEYGREHYHAVVGISHINHKDWYDIAGTIKAKKIRLSDLDKSKTRLSKYLTKLTNHAIKDSTKRCAIIYSR